MTKRGLIFDLDGTLVDSLPGIAEALNAALEGNGLHGHSEQAIRTFIGNGLETTVRRACPAGNNDETLVARLVESFHQHYQSTWRSRTLVYPRIRELLSDLASDTTALAVLANKSHACAVGMIAEIFPEIPFACILGLQPGAPAKPHPAGALEIARTIALAPNQCQIIGDSTMDIDTAKNASMGSCAVTFGYHDDARLRAARPDHIVANVPDLREWLANPAD